MNPITRLPGLSELLAWAVELLTGPRHGDIVFVMSTRRDIDDAVRSLLRDMPQVGLSGVAYDRNNHVELNIRFIPRPITFCTYDQLDNLVIENFRHIALYMGPFTPVWDPVVYAACMLARLRLSDKDSTVAFVY